VPIRDVASFTATGLTLASSRLDVRDFERRPGEARLMADVVDHQLVDIDGVQVVRAAICISPPSPEWCGWLVSRRPACH
jgi:hypothetical protein